MENKDAYPHGTHSDTVCATVPVPVVYLWVKCRWDVPCVRLESCRRCQLKTRPSEREAVIADDCKLPLTRTAFDTESYTARQPTPRVSLF